MPRLQPVRYTKIDDRPESMIAREKLAMASTDGRVDESVDTELNTYQVLELLDGSLVGEIERNADTDEDHDHDRSGAIGNVSQVPR